jgi:hypothetical protein
MALFTNPVILSDDGGTTTDRTFSYRRQLSDPKIIGADWIETGADPAAKSLLTVKHDIRSKTPRHLLQRTVWKHPAAETDNDDLMQITINFTCVANEAFSVAEIQEEINILKDAIEEDDFVLGMLNALL